MNKTKVKGKSSAIDTVFRFSPIFGAIIGMLIAAVFLMLWDINPGTFFAELAKGAVGSWRAI